jgi:hypothetical protein
MKRSLLFLWMALLFTAGFPQVLKTSPGSPVNQKDPGQGAAIPSAKAGGDLIWQSTFDWANPSDPRGWTLPDGWEIKDNSDLGNLWVWMKDSINGRFTHERTPSYFTSGADGFIVVPMDYYNYRDGIATENNSDTYIVTPPIDCSAASSVVISLHQYYRFCCENDNTGHLQLMVTNDDGAHWATYDLSFGIGHNTFTPEKYRAPEFNVSDVAAGMPSVRIKIYFHDVPYYFWAIDDLKLTEAYDNDLVLEDSWSKIDMGFVEPVGHTNFVPFTQMGMSSQSGGLVGDYQFSGALLNSGNLDAEDAHLQVTVKKNGTEVYDQGSPAMNIWTLERDTLQVPGVFTPDGYGDYLFSLTATGSGTDDKPVNNSATYGFTVDDTLYQRSDMSAESGTYTGVWANGNTGGDLLAVRYDIQEPTEVNSITAYLYSFTAAQNPTYQFVLLKYMPEDDDYNELLVSDMMTMDSTQLGWQTLPLVKDGESEFLEPGEYYAAWRAWADNGGVGMRLGWDMNDRAEFTGYNLIYLSSITTWYSSDKLPLMGLNLNTAGGPSEAPVTFNVDMTRHIANGEFHPGTDFVDISGTFNDWGSSAAMEDPEGDGIYTLTVENLPIGNRVEYKYQINGNEATSEFPDGPNRKYTVRYWNIVNDTFNNGNTTGTAPRELATTLSVYPNPASGAFTIEVSAPAPSNLVITLTSIQGQVVYRKVVKSAISFRESIGNDLAKGVYFLRVANGSELRTSKVILQ